MIPWTLNSDWAVARVYLASGVSKPSTGRLLIESSKKSQNLTYLLDRRPALTYRRQHAIASSNVKSMTPTEPSARIMHPLDGLDETVLLTLTFAWVSRHDQNWRN
jgi:hypothetical protein